MMRSRNMPWIVVLLALAASLVPVPAHAHRLNVFTYVLDDEVRVEAYFRKGAKAQGAKVEVFDANDALLVEGQTDESGMFAFPVPETKGELRITVSTGDAHQGECTLALGDGGGSAAQGERPIGVDEAAGRSAGALRGVHEKLIAIEQRLVDIQRDLHEYESRVSLDRVLAGIGFIVGLTGVVMFFLARRKTAG